MLVIHPDECIDFGVCEPECPVDAIKAESEPGLEKWLSLNAEYARIWPKITVKKAPPPDYKDWEGKPDKLKLLLAKSRRGSLTRVVTLEAKPKRWPAFENWGARPPPFCRLTRRGRQCNLICA